MAFDTNVPPPSPVALELKPPAAGPSPLEVAAQFQEMKLRSQAAQTQQLQQQGLQMQQQEQQLNLDQRRAINDAYRQAFTAQADGSLQLDKDKLTHALATAGHGEAIPGIMENWTKYQQSLASLQKTNAEIEDTRQKVATAEADAAGGLAATVKAANNDPTLFHTLLTDAMNRKIIQQAHFAPFDQAIGQAMQQDPTGESARQLVSKYTDQMIAGSPKQQELESARITAQARQTTATTGQDKEKREQAEKNFQNAVSALGANPPKDQGEYKQRVGQLEPAVAQRILNAVPVAQYDPAKSLQAIRQLGMTPEQQTQTTETARHNQVDEQQGAGRLAVSRQEQALRQKQFDATYGALLGPDGKPLDAEAAKAIASQDPLAVAVANYQAAPPATARGGPGASIMRKVLAINPDYQAQNWQAQSAILKDFSSGSSSKELVAINTALGHVGVLNQAIDALKNGDVRILNSVANRLGVETGSSAPAVFKTIVHRVGPELVKAYAGTGGGVEERVSSEHDFDPNLAPDTLRANVATTARLLDSKIKAKQTQWQGTMGTRPLPFSLTPEAQETMQRLTGGAPGGSGGPAAGSGGGRALPKGGGKAASEDTIKQFLQAAGNDKDLARKKLGENGWVIPAAK